MKSLQDMAWPELIALAVREGGEGACVDIALHLRDEPLEQQLATVERLRSAGCDWGSLQQHEGAYWVIAQPVRGLAIIVFLSPDAAAQLSPDGVLEQPQLSGPLGMSQDELLAVSGISTSRSRPGCRKAS